MNLNSVLLSILEHLSSANKPIVINWDSVQLWPAGALETMVKAGILIPTSSAKSLECNGCENRCFAEVLIQKSRASSRAFIACDDSEMQSQMGRIEIPLKRLKQWRCGAKQLAKVIAGLLKIENKITHVSSQNNIRIGMLEGSKGRRWVSLNTNPLSLEINRYTVPLEEILYFDDAQLTIDQTRIDNLVSRNPKSNDKKYTSSVDRREKRKMEIQTMHQDWKDAYLKLKKKNPAKSDNWCAKRIEGMDIAQGRDSETIRKNMR